MDDPFNNAADELAGPKKTKELSSSLANAAFQQSCLNHYYAIVWPEFESFRRHLKSQNVPIVINPIRLADIHLFKASLVILHPDRMIHVLEVTYDLRLRQLAFLVLLDSRRDKQTIFHYSLGTFGMVTTTKVYEIIKYFIQSIFGEDSHARLPLSTSDQTKQTDLMRVLRR